MFGVCEGRRSGFDPVQFDAGVKKKPNAPHEEASDE